MPLHLSVPTREEATGRLASLDAYRGFVILLMIWVNYLQDMPDIPWWLKHATAGEDGFTFPDLVFPGFLLMAGMAIPLAFAGRLDQPRLPALRKIAGRSVVLLAVGVLYENHWRYDGDIARLPKDWFCTFFFLSVILVCLRHDRKKAWMTGAGAALLVVLMFLFRGKAGDGYATDRLEHAWWGILGQIGWAYALCSVLYLVTRGNGAALMGAFAFMLALYLGDREGRLDFLPAAVRDFVNIGVVFGTTSAGMMTGVIAGRWFLDPSSDRAVHLRRLGRLGLFGVFLVLAGLLLRPYHGGISKVEATTSFAAVTGGINLLAFGVFYVVMDLMKRRAGAAFLIPAGVNALFAYLLPELWTSALGALGLGDLWWRLAWPYLEGGGAPGILNAAAVALFMLGLTWIGTRAGLRLKS